MATEQAQAVPPHTTAAEPATSDQLPGRTAGTEGQAVTTTSAGQPPTEEFFDTTSAGDAAAEVTQKLLDGLTDTNSIMRLTAQIPAGKLPELPDLLDPAAGREQSQPIGKRPERIRIGNLDEARQDAILALSDSSKTLDEVLQSLVPTRSTPQGGPAAIAPSPASDPAALIPPKESSADLQRQLSNLRTQKLEASRALDYEAMAQLEEQIDGLRDRIPIVQHAERSYSHARTRAFESSLETMSDLYPQANAGGPLLREIIRLDQMYKESGDPFYHHHNKPLMIASLAAANLGIAPRARADVPTQPIAKAAPIVGPTPRAAPPSPASGGARTQSYSAASVEQQTDSLLSSLKDSNDIFLLTRQLDQ